MSAYGRLEHRFRRIGRIQEAAAVLHWDQSVMMPEGGAEARGEQLAVLKALAHELLVDPAVSEWLAAAAGETLEPWQAANRREMERQWRHATAVPGELVEALARATTRSEIAWRAARRNADFAGLLPLWREVLARVREVAAAKGEALGLDPYDAMLDQYDPGRRAADLDRLFGELDTFLPGILAGAIERQARDRAGDEALAPVPIAAQRALAERLMRALGFDFARGRLDQSIHPFSSSTPGDARITTRYSEADPLGSLFAVMHETGHALYSLGLPDAWAAQPVGEDRGMAIHESQSLIMEMQAGRSRPFVAWLAGEMRTALGDGITAERLLRRVRRVEPGFIRVDADEVTYPFHILLRYRLERALIAGDLDLADLPGAFDDAMEQGLGIRPPTAREGCLQDIHWPDGAFGYFPTYTLGAMAAAQLYAAARRDEPGLEDRLAAGDVRPLIAWLRARVHARAAFDQTADDLLRAATGEPLDPVWFRRHLEARYLEDE